MSADKPAPSALTGGEGSSIELLYLGNHQWTIVNQVNVIPLQ